MGAPMVNVKIREPLPGTDELAVIDEINPNIVNVEVTTEAPGGYGTARVGLLPPNADYSGRYPSLTRSYKMRDKAHVEVDVGSFRAHEGIMQEYSTDFDGFQSAGYGLVAGEWGVIESGGTDLGNAIPILIQAIKAVPWWTVGRLEDPGSQRMWDDLNYQSSASVIDSIIQEGDATSPYTFLVYRDRRASVIAQVPPDRPHYVVAHDRSHMDLRWNVAQCIDGVRMTYTKPDGTLGVSDPVYASGVSSSDTHPRIVTLAGSSEASALVMPFLQAYIAYYSQPILTGTITYTDWAGPEGVAGYRVQAGQWIEIEGRGSSMILSTSSNLSSGATTLQVGPPAPATLAGVLRLVQRTVIRNRRHVDPITGQRVQEKMPYDLMELINQMAEAIFGELQANTYPRIRRVS